MPRREIASKSESELALPLVGRTNGVFNGFVIDLQNTDSILFCLLSGNVADGTHVISFEEDDDVGFSSPVVVPDTDIRGIANLIFIGPDDNKSTHASVVNNKRFIRPVLTVTGATGGAVISVMAIKQLLTLAPAV